jgi:FlaG/FlaF family flagellin (archaellin)
MMEGRRTERGITPAIGVALAVFITILLAGVFGVVLIELGSDLNEPAPNLAVEFSVTQQGQNVVVTHTAGSPLAVDNLDLRGPGTARFGGEELTAGDSFVIQTEQPSEEFRLLYTPGDTVTLLSTIENPLVADLGGVPPQVTVGYEDLALGSSGNDYDYNDWAFDMQTTIAGYMLEETRHATHLSIEFEPLARGGGYDHDQYLVPEDLGAGEYELTVSAPDGTVLRQERGAFDANTSLFLVNSGDVFGSNTNSNSGESCTTPGRTIQLELTLDTPTEIPDNPIDADRQHGAGLPFNLTMEPSGNNDTIGIGDPRLVTVPTDWRWPEENTHIANAYESVGPENASAGDVPNFEVNTWFEEPTDPSNVFDACR